MSDLASLVTARELAADLSDEPSEREVSMLAVAIQEAAAEGAGPDLIAERCGISIGFVALVLGRAEERLRDRQGRSIWTVWATESGTAPVPSVTPSREA